MWIVLTAVDDFFNALIFGAGSWLFLILFLGICFLITWRVWWFSIISFVACLFQMIEYINHASASAWTSDLIYKVIILGVGMIVFLYVFAGAVRRS